MPNRLRRVARVAAKPLLRFIRLEASSGIVLLTVTAVALLLANSGWAAKYHAFWQTSVGAFGVERSLEWLVNDGLMVVFFFVVGMEIRREAQIGELSDLRRAALPAAAALGGMVVPACLYLLLAGGPATHSGWGVPMATDIAFALGILALLGSRVPPSLRMLLLALAVIDDLGAIIVIALFYSTGVSAPLLALALLGVLAILGLQRLGVRRKLVYLLPAAVIWSGVYGANIHPTIAGVIVGLLTPVTKAEGELAAPADSLIHALHPVVAFAIMPIFALANAGVSLASGGRDAAGDSVVVAVVVGLCVGKPLGVVGLCWLSQRLGLSTLPAGIGLRHLIVLGLVAGVGFTMALFIAKLAFADEQLLEAAKLGVLLASAAAGVVSLIVGRILLSSRATAS